MTPVGHAAVALLAARALRLPPGPVVAAGVAPDIDFLLLAHPAFNELHRVITHNLLFAAAVSLAAAAAARGSVRVFLGAALAVVLHLACDAVLDANASNGIGVALLWPFSDTMWSPFNLMHRWAAANPAGWNDVAASVRLAVLGIAFELPFWAAAVFAWRRRAR